MAEAKLVNKGPRGQDKINVLVVEDEPLLRFALASELNSAGFQVFEAANSDEADAVLATQAPLDVLITDIQMPGFRNGIALAETVRETRPEIKIIIASGRIPSSEVGDLADAFFGKPYSLNGLITRVSELVGAREDA